MNYGTWSGSGFLNCKHNEPANEVLLNYNLTTDHLCLQCSFCDCVCREKNITFDAAAWECVNYFMWWLLCEQVGAESWLGWSNLCRTYLPPGAGMIRSGAHSVARWPSSGGAITFCLFLELLQCNNITFCLSSELFQSNNIDIARSHRRILASHGVQS